MRKFCFLIILSILAFNGFAQKGKPVQLTSSQTFKGFTKQGVMRVIKPIFNQDGTTLTADSADFNQNANTFDAFGNVMITQPNGTTISADLLNYNGVTRKAILTNNVRMNDRGTVLTTNFLTYNTGTRYGEYFNGGRIENQGDVLTSKSGYYFGNMPSPDAYFRYDVVVNTADATITTDTLKYNTGSRTSYFYGPTNIKGKKDKTNLYTENGRYNTITGQAWFGKRNKYIDGSKTLKGDSLYYDRQLGEGKAIGRVTFIDTLQRSVLRGDLGKYYEKDQSAMVTGHAYVILETKQDSNKVDSIFMAADTLRTKLILLKDLKPANQDELESNEEIAMEGGEETPAGAESQSGPTSAGTPQTETNTTPENTPTSTETSETTDTPAPKEEPSAKEVSPDKEKEKPKEKKKKKRGLLGLFKKQDPKSEPDSTSSKSDPKKGQQDERITTTGKDTVATDSAALVKAKAVSDTARTRIVLAYHKVKIFKSDLQTKADSAFYSYGDSIIRCYRNPMIWTQGSQLSADTIFLQLKNQKLDNMLLQHDGFIASTELDSSKFNQVRGKVLTGLFRDNKLWQMFVDGNAESIYYTVEDSAYSGMNRSLSSRMRLEFQNNKLKEVTLIRKPEGKYYPLDKVNKDDEILKGFIWKPNERPKSKEEVLGLTKKPVKKSGAPVKKTPASKSPAGKANPANKKKN